MESKGLEMKIGEHDRMVISTLDFVKPCNHPLGRPINSLYDLVGSLYGKLRGKRLSENGRGGFHKLFGSAQDKRKAFEGISFHTKQSG